MKKSLFVLLYLFLVHWDCFSQTTIKMEKQNGVFMIPCKVNGLAMKFIYDTGASHVSISLSEALFMLKNGYLQKDHIIENEYYQIANGEIQAGTKIMLTELEIAGHKIYNIEASIIHSLNAPLLLGQSALSKLGTISFDYSNQTLTIFDNDLRHVAENNIVKPPKSESNKESGDKLAHPGKYLYKTTLINRINLITVSTLKIDIPLTIQPNENSYVINRYPSGTIAYVLQKTDSDYYLVFVDGEKGYVKKMFLKRF